MLNSVTFKNYRGFAELNLENLKPINLIVGANNVGKTAVLEGLVLALSKGLSLKEASSIFRICSTTDNLRDFESWLVNKSCTTGDALISATTSQVDLIRTLREIPRQELESFILRNSGLAQIQNSGHDSSPEVTFGSNFRWSNNAPFFIVGDDLNVSAGKLWSQLPKLRAAAYSNSTPERTSAIFNEVAPLNPEGEDEIQEFLKNSIEPRLKRIRYAKPKGSSTHLAYVQLEGLKEMIPFTQLGQAFASTFHLYCLLYAEKPDILLVDEIENGIYYQGLSDFWKGLHATIQDRDTQLFATTHSFECMRAAHEQAKALDCEYPINFIRLDRHPVSGKIVATEFGEDEMEAAISNHWDMR